MLFRARGFSECPNCSDLFHPTSFCAVRISEEASDKLSFAFTNRLLFSCRYTMMVVLSSWLVTRNGMNQN